MLRQLLTILLLFSWVIVSELDAFEQCDFGNGVSAYSHDPNKKLPGNTNDRVRFANDIDIDESAEHQQARHSPVLKRPSGESPDSTAVSFQKVFQLHKLHRVFLI